MTFIKLESLESIPEERRLSYQDLAISIFTVNQPKESKNLTRSECTYCETMIADWSTICPSCNVKFPICVASGKPIMDANQQWTCSRCKHNCLRVELVSFNNCPLCHHPISS
uniref:Uncharacterized protein n=1 Tax=Tetranychus urticae TaxID=32264 RepID=T1KN88_TETUR